MRGFYRAAPWAPVRKAPVVASLLLACGMVAGCTQAPVTGREQLILISEEQANELGAEAWQQINSEMTVSKDAAAQRRVQEIGQALVAASGAEGDRKSTRLNSSHSCASRLPSSACKKQKP